jgi:hypothetical protein
LFSIINDTAQLRQNIASAGFGLLQLGQYFSIIVASYKSHVQQYFYDGSASIRAFIIKFELVCIMALYFIFSGGFFCHISKLQPSTNKAYVAGEMCHQS